MKCFNCKSEDVAVFFVETVPCQCCGEESKVFYCLCKDCLSTFKVVGDNLISTQSFSKEEICALLGVDVADLDLYLSIPVTKTGEITKVETIKAPFVERTMKEVVHHCIRCGEIAFETGPGKYYCCQCDFKWEIV